VRICEARKSYSDFASCSDSETEVPLFNLSTITTPLALAAWLTSSRLYWKVKYFRLRRTVALGVAVEVRAAALRTVRALRALRVERLAVRRVERVERDISFPFLPTAGRLV
jgi:hypothetical protein